MTQKIYVKMTVGLLKREIADYADDMPVYVSSDEEGNNLHPKFIADMMIVGTGEDEHDAIVIYPLNSSDDIT